MTPRPAFGASVRALGLCLAFCAQAQTPSAALTVEKRSTMSMHASGTFDVKLTPEGQEDKAEGSTVGRMSIEKQFQGELEGTSKGQMLSAMSDVPGSAGYVALERVTGTLKGRRGSFVLQHTGTMSKGGFQLSVTVVPDSGSAQLVGLSGTFTIRIVEGKHVYEFEYLLPSTPPAG